MPSLATGQRGQRLRPDAAEIHIPQPPGTGGPGRASEHFPDQPDAQRPQPRGLCQRAGDFPQSLNGAPGPDCKAGTMCA